MELAVIGREEFVLGFQLAGIRRTIVAKEKIFLQIKELMADETLGVVIIDQTTFDALDYHDRMDVERSVAPVFVPLSTTASMDNLKQLIKKSIGIDLIK